MIKRMKIKWEDVYCNNKYCKMCPHIYLRAYIGDKGVASSIHIGSKFYLPILETRDGKWKKLKGRK